MMTTSMPSDAAQSDSDLVGESLSGSHAAFGRIVSRYQSLVCSLAYSATGSLPQSEDLAQETFVTAWRQLAALREPEKLRSWLCGIARNLINNWLRRQGREPSHKAESLEEIPESHSPEPQPLERAISRDEADILWRSLERIPELYREPLILFYREHQSVLAVAANLDLTEDTVKQRLSRGRKLLQEQVLAFVEGALERTTPGHAFTLSVLAVLQVLEISGKAAMLGAAAAKAGATSKVAAAAGMAAAALGSVLGFLGLWIGYRTSVEASQSDRERDFAKTVHRRLIGCILVFFVASIVLGFLAVPLLPAHHQLFVALALGLAAAYACALAAVSVWIGVARRKLVKDLTASECATNPTKPIWEYRSRFAPLGLPFIHIRMGDRMAPPVRAWIAFGDCAFGVLVAFGGLAIAPISIGGCAVGFFTLGGFSLGALAVGGLGIGWWAFGGLAIGWQAFGGCAVAWNAALGGAAVARDLAVGGVASAAQANTDIANAQILGSSSPLVPGIPFFHYCIRLYHHYLWFNLTWILPMFIQWRVVAKNRRRAALANP
jgi:RNA polymerase sigma factor (sigma-70 family)